MFVYIAFFVGLALLFKGPFRIAGRNVSRQISRRSAFTLMLPLVVSLVLSFCGGLTIASSNPDQLDYNALMNVAEQVYTIGAILLIFVVAFVVYQIYTLPKSAPLTSPEARFAATPAASSAYNPPNVMTPAEAATYLRISEAQVRELIDAGQIPAARISSDYRIARIALDDFLSHNKADDNEDFAEFRN